MTAWALVALAALAAPARADWAPVPDVPATELFSMFANGDSLAVGADTTVYISTNGGTSWLATHRPVSNVAAITAVWLRNGRWFAGTFGQGVFVSDDLGSTWVPFNDGLAGGAFDSQLDVVGFAERAGVLFAATAGAGVYARPLDGVSAWQHFGDAFEPNQASDVTSLARGAGRLLASAGANGMVFTNDPGDADWAISDLDNLGIHAGLSPFTATWNGSGWVVGTNLGIFRSVAGQEPWTRFDPGIGPVNWVTFATRGRHLFAALSQFTQAVIEESDDDGTSWQNPQVFPGAFIHDLAVSGATIFAARGDGLWKNALPPASVPSPGAAARVRFAIVGPQPFTTTTRARFELEQPGHVSVETFDVAGRRMPERIEGWWPAGPHDIVLSGHAWKPGLYHAVLTAGGVRVSAPLVRVE